MTDRDSEPLDRAAERIWANIDRERRERFTEQVRVRLAEGEAPPRTLEEINERIRWQGTDEEEEPEAFGEGEPCKRGEAAAKTGCTPAAGEGKKAEVGSRAQFKLGGKTVNAAFRQDGATHVEVHGNLKVVTYTMDGVRRGYIEDAEGGNVRPFLIRGKEASPVPLLASDAERIQQEAIEKAQEDHVKQRLARRQEFQQNVGHQILSAPKLASELSQAGLPIYNKTVRARQSGVRVKEIPGKKTWLMVEWQDAPGDDNDVTAKSQEVQARLEQRGFVVTRPYPDQTILAVRKPLGQ